MENNSSLVSNIIREVLIPEIEREVNEGKTFANLRQIYNSVILAAWYKKNLKESLLGQVYVGQNKTAGVDTQDKQINRKIYDQYIEAFKKGVYNYIREDYNPATQEIIPRKYFSGGTNFERVRDLLVSYSHGEAGSLSRKEMEIVGGFLAQDHDKNKVNVKLYEVSDAELAKEIKTYARSVVKQSRADAGKIVAFPWMKNLVVNAFSFGDPGKRRTTKDIAERHGLSETVVEQILQEMADEGDLHTDDAGGYWPSRALAAAASPIDIQSLRIHTEMMKMLEDSRYRDSVIGDRQFELEPDDLPMITVTQNDIHLLERATEIITILLDHVGQETVLKERFKNVSLEIRQGEKQMLLVIKNGASFAYPIGIKVRMDRSNQIQDAKPLKMDVSDRMLNELNDPPERSVELEADQTIVFADPDLNKALIAEQIAGRAELSGIERLQGESTKDHFVIVQGTDRDSIARQLQKMPKPSLGSIPGSFVYDIVVGLVEGKPKTAATVSSSSPIPNSHRARRGRGRKGRINREPGGPGKMRRARPRKTFLLIEPDKAKQFSYQEILANRKIFGAYAAQVVSANSAEEADETIKKRGEGVFDLIIMRFEMRSDGGRNGMELARNIASKWNLSVPIVLVGNFTDGDIQPDVNDAKREGLIFDVVSESDDMTSSFKRLLQNLDNAGFYIHETASSSPISTVEKIVEQAMLSSNVMEKEIRDTLLEYANKGFSPDIFNRLEKNGNALDTWILISGVASALDSLVFEELPSGGWEDDIGIVQGISEETGLSEEIVRRIVTELKERRVIYMFRDKHRKVTPSAFDSLPVPVERQVGRVLGLVKSDVYTRNIQPLEHAVDFEALMLAFIVIYDQFMAKQGGNYLDQQFDLMNRAIHHRQKGRTRLSEPVRQMLGIHNALTNPDFSRLPESVRDTLREEYSVEIQRVLNLPTASSPAQKLPKERIVDLLTRFLPRAEGFNGGDSHGLDLSPESLLTFEDLGLTPNGVKATIWIFTNQTEINLDSSQRKKIQGVADIHRFFGEEKGASSSPVTSEEIADQVMDFLENGNIHNSVNFPECRLDRQGDTRLCIVNKNVQGMVGKFSTVLADAGINIVELLNKSRDNAAYNIVDITGKLPGEVEQQLTGIDGVIKVRTLKNG